MVPLSRSRSCSPTRSVISGRPRTRDWPTAWDPPNPAASSSSAGVALPQDGERPAEPASHNDRWPSSDTWRREDCQTAGSTGAWPTHDPRWPASAPPYQAGDQQQQPQRHHDHSWDAHRDRYNSAGSAAYSQPQHQQNEPRAGDDWHGGYREASGGSRGWRDEGPADRFDLPPVPWQNQKSGSRDAGRHDGRWAHDRHEDYELPLMSRQAAALGPESRLPYDEGERSYDRLPDGPMDNESLPSAQTYHRPPSEPSKHVIFLGIDPDMEETDLFNFLAVSGSEVESTTIIRDKVTGLSKGFGFALFKSLEDSARFIDASHPYVLLPFGDVPPRRVKVDYSATTGAPSARPTTAWSGAAGFSGEANDGMRDIATGASGGGRILLFRGVDGKTRWSDVLHKLEDVEITKGSIRRVVGLVSKDQGGSSWGFGFVELRTIEAARALLAHIMSATAFPQGFSFPPSAKPVSVTFASALAFVPHKSTATTDPAPAAHTIPAGGPGGLGDLPPDVSVRYWDERAMLRCEWASGWEEADQREVEAAALSRLAAKKSSRATVTRATTASAAPKEAADPVPDSKGMLRRLEKDAMMPIAIKLGGGSGAGKAKAEKAVASAFGARADDSDEEADEGAKTRLPVKGKLYKVPPMATSRKVATSINKWNTTQKELADVSDQASSSTSRNAFQPSAANTTLAHHHQPRAFSTTTEAPTPVAQPTPLATLPSLAAAPLALPSDEMNTTDDFEYSDVKKTACLLCQRQLKSIDLLRKHNAASDLHKRNLLDTSLRQLAAERVAAATAAQASEYRDRAAERRVAFNQPEKVRSGSGSTSTTAFQPKRKYVEGPVPEPVAPPPEPVLAPAEDASNVGNKLLAKMGWTAGQGLGLQGEGRVDPVETQLRAVRAGLGAASKPPPPSGGAPGGGGGRGGSYAEAAMDSARDRY